MTGAGGVSDNFLTLGEESDEDVTKCLMNQFYRQCLTNSDRISCQKCKKPLSRKAYVEFLTELTCQISDQFFRSVRVILYATSHQFLTSFGNISGDFAGSCSQLPTSGKSLPHWGLSAYLCLLFLGSVLSLFLFFLFVLFLF